VWKLKSCSINNLLPIGAHILGAVHDERRVSQVRAGVSTASSALIQLRVVPSLENQGKIGEMPAMGAKSFSDPQGPPRCARRKARNLHHGADRRDRRFDRSGSRCGIVDYLKQGI
jgi:hypothetical protein